MCDPTFMRYLELSSSWRKTVQWWLPGTGGGGNGEILFNGDRVSVGEDEKVLEMDSDVGCTTI